MLDLSGRKIVIFGGGSVGSAKPNFSAAARTQLSSASTFPKGFRSLRHRQVRLSLLTWQPRTQTQGNRFRGFLVIPATSSSELNRKISNIAGKAIF